MRHRGRDRWSRGSRRGLSLIEVMVTIAIMVALIAVLAPTMRSVFEMDQRAAARKLAVLYERLHDEAVMRNMSFRVAYFLEEGRYVVESGEAGALIAASPEDREQFDEEMRNKLRNMNDKQRMAFLQSRKQPFESMGNQGKMEFRLPSGVQFGGVYTPQYGRLVRPGDDLGGEKDEPLRVLSYVMNNGFIEHTLVQLVDLRGFDGFTVEVEPLSGVVHMHPELIDVYDIREDIPENGPSLPN